jgi:hypothetical protein
MSIDFEKEPDYEKIIDALIEKTKQGKLRWHETADEHTFLAAVKGQRTFAISQVGAEEESGSTSITPWDDATERFQLVIRDVDGQAFVEKTFRVAPPGSIGSSGSESTYSETADKAKDLYETVRRVVLNVDEKVDETVQLLDQL